MQLNEIMELQASFDKAHSSTFPWFTPITEDNLGILQFLILCIVGELGELANDVKKVIRGDCSLNEMQPGIEDEIADVFIYLVKLCNQLGINLEGAFLSKLERNKKRFTDYETNK